MTPASAPRGLLPAARSVPGTLVHQRAAPSPALREHVAHFWWVRWALEAPFEVQTLPHPTVHLVMEGARAHVHADVQAPFRRTLRGEGAVLGVKFRPGAFRLEGVDARRVMGQRVAASRVLGSVRAAQLLRAVGSGWSVPPLSDLEAVLSRWVVPLEPCDVELRDAVEWVERQRGLVSLDALAERTRRSRRTLQRHFLERVGVPLRWVLQRYRLHEAVDHLATTEARVTDVAAQTGYADQAHLTRQLRRASGVTPKALRSR